MITRRDALKGFIFASMSWFCTSLSTASGQESPAAATFAKFLQGADIQAENQAQRDEVTRALKDMATESPATLRERRYADYQGKQGKWTLLQLLKHHFVPRENVYLTDDILFEALATDQGKALVKTKLTEYKRQLSRTEAK
jgi:hypothetical protein